MKKDNPLLEEAKQAVSDGYVLAGLMQAALAFEHTLLAKAREHRLMYGYRTSVAKALRRFDTFMKPSEVNQLFEIWELRNQLIHMSPESAERFKQKPELIGRLESGIRLLVQ